MPRDHDRHRTQDSSIGERDRRAYAGSGSNVAGEARSRDGDHPHHEYHNQGWRDDHEHHAPEHHPHEPDTGHPGAHEYKSSHGSVRHRPSYLKGNE